MSEDLSLSFERAQCFFIPALQLHEPHHPSLVLVRVVDTRVSVQTLVLLHSQQVNISDACLLYNRQYTDAKPDSSVFICSQRGSNLSEVVGAPMFYWHEPD